MSFDAIAEHLDIIGDMYSEFLKYAFSNGKEKDIVLRAPYVTKMMAEILNIYKDSRTMDLAMGFRVIIMIVANSISKSTVSYSLSKLETSRFNNLSIV